MLPAPAMRLPGGTGWARTGGNNRHLFVICRPVRDSERAISAHPCPDSVCFPLGQAKPHWRLFSSYDSDETHNSRDWRTGCPIPFSR